MNYKTYAEAKIANPDSEIVTTTKLHSNGPEFEFLPVKFIDGYYRSQCDSKTPNVEDGIWVICNPADYCSSVKEFLEAGFKLSVGDLFLGVDGKVIAVREARKSSVPYDDDCDRYILSAAALNGGCKIPASYEQWTIYNNTLPLCDLTDEQAAMLFNAWRGGDNIQFRTMDVNVWIDKPEYDAVIKKGGVYRVKSKSERELFIEHTTKVMRDAGTKCQDNHEYFGIMFDAGARYIDLTHHFGENI